MIRLLPQQKKLATAKQLMFVRNNLQYDAVMQNFFHKKKTEQIVAYRLLVREVQQWNTEESHKNIESNERKKERETDFFFVRLPTIFSVHEHNSVA